MMNIQPLEEVVMVTVIRRQNFITYQHSYTQKRHDFRKFKHPRQCMIVSVGFILLGIGVPALMVMELIPLNLFMFFVGFGLVSTGSTIALIKCGEI